MLSINLSKSIIFPLVFTISGIKFIPIFQKETKNVRLTHRYNKQTFTLNLTSRDNKRVRNVIFCLHLKKIHLKCWKII